MKRKPVKNLLSLNRYSKNHFLQHYLCVAMNKEQTVINVEGMTCSHCASTVTHFLEKKGLEKVSVDFASGEVSFTNAREISLADISAGIKKLGYRVADKAQEKTKSYSPTEVKFAACAVLTLPLLMHMALDIPLLHHAFFQLFLASPVMIIGLMHFGKSAWGSVKSGSPNMDVLITIGSFSAYAYSIAGITLAADEANYLFFETSATIITLVLLGNVIEQRALKQTGKAIDELKKLQPLKALKIVYNASGMEEVREVNVSEIAAGDLLRVNTGDVIPADGIVTSGNASADESMITGESMPVEKQKGNKVISGSTLVAGNMKMMAEKTGNDTALAAIIDMVKKAQAEKPPVQKLGDRISAVFVPVVLIISVATFLVSAWMLSVSFEQSLMRSIAVLVISCPCAMGLATPAALAVGLGRAARNGILIKNGAILENLDGIKTFVFDKTGTLTTGNFSLNEFRCFSFDEEEAKEILLAIEEHSSHPIARALVKIFSAEIKSRNRKLINVREEKGTGIFAGDTDGNTYFAGSFSALKNKNVPPGYQVYLLKNDQPVAAVSLQDELRSNAADLIKYLHQKNIHTVMISGDSKERCMEIAGATGIKEVYSGKLPGEKLLIIDELKKTGKVAMMGDGINDAPALTRADVAFSFSAASHAAVNSAEVVILKTTDFLEVKHALGIGRHTLLTIKQNLFWAFAYNVVAIPVAAAGFLNPMIGALSMAFSDVVVIGNSIRLRYKKLARVK